MPFLRPTYIPTPGDLPETGGGLAPVPVASGVLDVATNLDVAVDLSPWRGRQTHVLARTQQLRSTVRPYDETPENRGDVVLLDEVNRDNQIGQQVAQPTFQTPGPRRLEPTTYRGD